jgi:hypothetical protein
MYGQIKMAIGGFIFMATDVVLHGHSFIRRLRDYINNNHVNHNLRLHPARFMISCSAQCGLTIERLIHE